MVKEKAGYLPVTILEQTVEGRYAARFPGREVKLLSKDECEAFVPDPGKIDGVPSPQPTFYNLHLQLLAVFRKHPLGSDGMAQQVMAHVHDVLMVLHGNHQLALKIAEIESAMQGDEQTLRSVISNVCAR